jgi:hypothetical protein
MLMRRPRGAASAPFSLVTCFEIFLHVCVKIADCPDQCHRSVTSTGNVESASCRFRRTDAKATVAPHLLLTPELALCGYPP